MRATLWLLLATSKYGFAAEDKSQQGVDVVSDANQVQARELYRSSAPLKNAGENCFDPCFKQIGFCEYCGLGNACCFNMHRFEVHQWQYWTQKWFGWGGSRVHQKPECMGHHIAMVPNGPKYQCVKGAFAPGQAVPFTAPPAKPWVSQAQCTDYMSEKGCKWTLNYNCPGQNAGLYGEATNDGKIGYRCCCGLNLWQQDVPKFVTPTRAQRSECRNYMRSDGCQWTKQFSCPGQGQDVYSTYKRAHNDGSVGFRCCCIFGFWEGYSGITQAQQALGYNPETWKLLVGPKGNKLGHFDDNAFDAQVYSKSGPNVVKRTFSHATGQNFVATEHHGPILDPVSSQTEGACQFGICTDLSQPASATPIKDQAYNNKHNKNCICKKQWITGVPGCADRTHYGCTPACGNRRASWCEVEENGCLTQVGGHYGDAWAWCSLNGETTTLPPRPAQVDCGSYHGSPRKAPSCSVCGPDPSWCHGDCQFKGGKCIWKGAENSGSGVVPLPIQGSAKNCGGDRFVDRCVDCGNTPAMCKFDCQMVGTVCQDVNWVAVCPSFNNNQGECTAYPRNQRCIFVGVVGTDRGTCQYKPPPGPTAAPVSCGGHFAGNCGQCGHSSLDCNGDCEWKTATLVAGGGKCVQRHGPGVPVAGGRRLLHSMAEKSEGSTEVQIV